MRLVVLNCPVAYVLHIGIEEFHNLRSLATPASALAFSRRPFSGLGRFADDGVFPPNPFQRLVVSNCIGAYALHIGMEGRYILLYPLCNSLINNHFINYCERLHFNLAPVGSHIGGAAWLVSWHANIGLPQPGFGILIKLKYDRMSSR